MSTEIGERPCSGSSAPVFGMSRNLLAENSMRCVTCAILWLLMALPVESAELLSGPMVGHTTSSSATIWVETDKPAAVRVHYWVDAGSEPMVRGTAVGRTSDKAPHTGVVKLEGLESAQVVHYELEIDGRSIRPQTPQVFSLLPAEHEGGQEGDGISEFSVAFASCMSNARTPIQPVWEQVGVHRPDALLLIGDNNYMPNHPGAYETSEEVAQYAMSRYHRYLRDLPGLRTVLATTPTYAIWDDHDFGPNNSDRTFKWRELSLALFKKYWPNPYAGTTETPGVFHSVRIADVEFFLLDDRYHRDPNDAPDRRTMLGDGQLTWLKNKLKQSTATFKVIVNGHIMLLDRRDEHEYWARFGDERDRFIDWMYGEGITGVFFISGDWHVGSLSRMEFTRENYPLYELVSSNAGLSSIPVQADLHQYAHHRQVSGHNRRFSGPIVNDVREYNFGLLKFSGSKGSRKVTLQIIDHHGEVRIAHELRENDLSPHWNK